MPKVILQDVRGSYVYVDKMRKKKDNGDDGGYGMQILLNKSDKAQVKKMNRAIDAALIEKFGKDAVNKKGRYKLPMRDGDDERDDEEYEGVWFFNANNKKKPGLVNKANEPADAEDIEEYLYSGAYFHCSINVYGFPAKDGGKPGVAIGLNNVMLRKKGESLDGTTSATSDFEDFADNEDNDDDWEL